jgi:hypothetical protein
MTWQTNRCINCGESFGGPNRDAAVVRFFTHPRHECVAKWYPLVDPPSPYSQIGTKR